MRSATSGARSIDCWPRREPAALIGISFVHPIRRAGRTRRVPIHTLHRKQTIFGTRDAAWKFFSDPHNLAQITPPRLDFQIITPDLPDRIYAGLMIQYRVRPLLGIPMTWLTEITQVEEGCYFVDEQRTGPYAIWHHEHWFHDAGSGRVEIADRVTYRLPFGWLAEPIHPLIVLPQLEAIFDHRTVAVEKLFPKPGEDCYIRQMSNSRS
jgi:ligand-binding SRPBCC domain-containing protein